MMNNGTHDVACTHEAYLYQKWHDAQCGDRR